MAPPYLVPYLPVTPTFLVLLAIIYLYYYWLQILTILIQLNLHPHLHGYEPIPCSHHHCPTFATYPYLTISMTLPLQLNTVVCICLPVVWALIDLRDIWQVSQILNEEHFDYLMEYEYDNCWNIDILGFGMDLMSELQNQLIKIICGHRIAARSTSKLGQHSSTPGKIGSPSKQGIMRNGIIINQSTFRSPMTSPYSTRSRKPVPASQELQHPCKELEMSPKTSSRPQRSSAVNQSIRVQPVEKNPYMTPQLSRSKRETQYTLLSNPEHLNLEHSSSSLNESSAVRQQSKNKEVENDRPQPLLSSLGVEQNQVFASPQMEKHASKKSDDGFINEKKSYRNQFHRRTVGVPYRKCHSTMEEKVVGIINKINSGKECHREIETLLERTRKISIKEMMNRYFVSGLHVIHRLTKEDKTGLAFDRNLVDNIAECIQELKIKIEAELDCPKAYEIITAVPKTLEFPKQKLIARAFKILRKKQRDQQRYLAEKKAIETANWFIENNHNDLQVFLDELVRC